MSQPLVVSIPHRLGQAEAERRLKTGLESARARFGTVLTIQNEIWTGHSVSFQAKAVGQTATGKVDVEDDHVRLEVMLPWLLATLAEKIVPILKQQGYLLLDKK